MSQAPPTSVWRAPGMPWLVVFTFLGFAGYAVLLPLAPLWAVEGGAGPDGAGLVNAVKLGVTVAVQFMVPSTLRRFGWGPVMAVGVLFLGLPSLAHLLSQSLGWVLLLAALRGVGFAVLTVTGSAAVAYLVDPARRGAAIGTYGLAVALPNLTFLPFGPAIVDSLGWWPVFAVGALPVLAVPAAFTLARYLPHGTRGEREDRAAPHTPDEPAADDQAYTVEEEAEVYTATAEAPAGFPGQLRRIRYTLRAVQPLAVPAGILLGVTLAGGAIITFAPQLVENAWAATLGLLAMGLTGALARWRVGGLADRYGAGAFVWPGTVIAVVAMVALALLLGLDDWSPVAAGMPTLWWVLLLGLLGVGYGALQNLTLVLSLQVVSSDRISTASAVWNAGFDAGTGLGAAFVGVIAAGAGFGWALLVAGLLCAATLPLAWRVR